jgi:phosphatidate cytidylyltransferase
MAPSPADGSAPALRSHPLRARIVSALVLAPIALAVVWLADHGPAFGAAFNGLLVLAAGWLAHEWRRVTSRGGSGVAGIALIAGVAAVVAGSAAIGAAWPGVIGGVALALAVYGLARGAGVEAPGWLAAGAVAIGVPCAAFVWLRQQPAESGVLVVWLLAVVWATDIGAYAAGRTIGGPRLAPRISPNKTWAGLAGGVAAAAVVGGALGVAVGAASAPVLVPAGAVLALIAQVGDLGESLVKRRFGVKDAGALIPGHGGLLDRVDGLLTTTPVVALVVWLKGGSVLAWT